MRTIKTIIPGIAPFLLILGLQMLSIPAWACSLSEGALLPSNYDLVKEADAIVLAEAASFDRVNGAFTFRVLEAVKGHFPDETLVQEGVNADLGKGDEKDFSSARPGAFTGGCKAYDYRVGRTYLLFLGRNEEVGWQISGPAFSRINEEVGGSDSPWFVAVKHYVRIDSAGNYEAEKAELRKLQERARKAQEVQEVKAYPPGLVKDIEDYFESPYPSKSYQDLFALYGTSSKENRSQAVWALARSTEPEAESFFTNLVQSGEWKEYPGPVSAYVQRTKAERLVKALAASLPTLKKEMRGSVLWALVETAGDAEAGSMLAALRSANHAEAARLATWFVLHPSDEATEVIRGMVDGKYQERWELAFGLAGLGDLDVLEWARGIIGSSDKDRWMGLYVVARSPLPEADELARAIIRTGKPESLTPLIQGYGESFNPNRWDRLRDIVHLEKKNPEVEKWLRGVLGNMARTGDDRAAELLELRPGG